MKVCTYPHRTQMTPSADLFSQSKSMKVMPVVVILISRLANKRPLQTWQLKKGCAGRVKKSTLDSLQSDGVGSLDARDLQFLVRILRRNGCHRRPRPQGGRHPVEPQRRTLSAADPIDRALAPGEPSAGVDSTLPDLSRCCATVLRPDEFSLGDRSYRYPPVRGGV